MKQHRKQPDAWSHFGRYYTGCTIGNHTVKTVLIGMDALAEVIDKLPEEDVEEITAAMKDFTWH